MSHFTIKNLLGVPLKKKKKKTCWATFYQNKENKNIRAGLKIWPNLALTKSYCTA